MAGCGWTRASVGSGSGRKTKLNFFTLPVRAAVLSGRAAANELIPATVNDDGNERGQKIVC
jgi:hypothetical protein